MIFHFFRETNVGEKENNKAIIQNNLQKIEEMMQVAMRESMGGNAQTNKGWPCVAVNGYCEENGKIVVFGNSQDLTNVLDNKKNLTEFSIRLMGTPIGFIPCNVLIHTSGQSNQAKDILIATMDKYSTQKYGRSEFAKEKTSGRFKIWSRVVIYDPGIKGEFNPHNWMVKDCDNNTVTVSNIDFKNGKLVQVKVPIEKVKNNSER